MLAQCPSWSSRRSAWLSAVTMASVRACVFAYPLRRISTKGSCHLPKIYTKTGDKGTTSTFTGERLPKSNALFEALGATDELSCTIGLAREFASDRDLPCISQLEEIQCILQDVGSSLATLKRSASANHLARTHFNAHHVKDLEAWIDEYTKQLPPLKNFILPSGGKTSSSLHIARAQCRNAERRVVTLMQQDDADEEVLKFLNRLSDYLFTVARFACQAEGREERVYKRLDRPMTSDPK